MGKSRVTRDEDKSDKKYRRGYMKQVRSMPKDYRDLGEDTSPTDQKKASALSKAAINRLYGQPTNARKARGR